MRIGPIRTFLGGRHPDDRGLYDSNANCGNTLNRLNGNHAESDINAFVAELRSLADAANAGDLSRPASMLMGQAATLDAVFYRLIG